MCVHGMSWKSADPGRLWGRGEDGSLGETTRRSRPMSLCGSCQWVLLSPGPRGTPPTRQG